MNPFYMKNNSNYMNEMKKVMNAVDKLHVCYVSKSV